MARVGGFGPVVFEVSDQRILTWSSLSRTKRAKFGTHNVMNSKQRLEFQGVDLQDVSMTIRLNSEFTHPEAEIKKMLDMVEEGKAHTLLLGSKVIGKFVLQRMRETRKYTDGAGNILTAEISLKLKEYN